MDSDDWPVSDNSVLVVCLSVYSVLQFTIYSGDGGGRGLVSQCS